MTGRIDLAARMILPPVRGTEQRRRIIPADRAQPLPRRADRWVFGDRINGAYLVRFGWTKIIRHQLVGGTASPDDLALASYWVTRRRGTLLPMGRATLRQPQAQWRRKGNRPFGFPRWLQDRLRRIRQRSGDPCPRL
jgi:hypothetical protein